MPSRISPTRCAFIFAASVLVLSAALNTFAATPSGTTARVSVDSAGGEANGPSVYSVGISSDGRFVTFTSRATNLVPSDTNGTEDVFLLDRHTSATERVSVASDGSQGNDRSGYWGGTPVSSDGRYVAFWSAASNLVNGDTNACGLFTQLGHCPDIFVRDRIARTTERVNMASDGSQANDQSFDAAMSADGRFVAFESFATNLVPGDTNGAPDVFVRDRQTGTTERVSVASGGSEGNGVSGGPSISSDGRYVAFDSAASNLAPGDTNGAFDVFVRDRQTGATERVSVASDGSQGNGPSGNPSISSDGRYVAFSSIASNLVLGDTNTCPGWTVPGQCPDVFVRDRQTGTTERVSVASDGSQGNGQCSFDPCALVISGDGRYVAFQSTATNLVPGDTNGVPDIFVRDTQAPKTWRVSVDTAGNEANGESDYLAISQDGSHIAFNSGASNLIAGDGNGVPDTFVRDAATSVGGIAEQPDVTALPSITSSGRNSARYILGAVGALMVAVCVASWRKRRPNVPKP